jgi:hypothetical protein
MPRVTSPDLIVVLPTEFLRTDRGDLLPLAGIEGPASQYGEEMHKIAQAGWHHSAFI